MYKALEAPASTPVLSNEDRQAILDVLCCFYDFSNNKPSKTGDLRDAWYKAQSTQDEMREIYWPTSE